MCHLKMRRIFVNVLHPKNDQYFLFIFVSVLKIERYLLHPCEKGHPFEYSLNYQINSV